MDTTKNLNFSANIPQLEWEKDENLPSLLTRYSIDNIRYVLARIDYASEKNCFFTTYFGGKEELYEDKLYTIEEAKKAIQFKYVAYVCSLLNEVAKVTTDSCLSYNDHIKK